MILIDRIVRYFSKDIMLPTNCNANKKELLCPKKRCDCKIYCKRPPKNPKPVWIKTHP